MSEILELGPAKIKDPHDLCQWLAPLGQERRLALLRYKFFGEVSNEETRELADRAQAERDRLVAKWPDGDRLTLAMNLSPTIDVFEDLMLGRYVDPTRLDQDWLRWAKREKFVALKPALECL